MSDPVENITIQGGNFRDTSYTYMDPHGMPSGGDWVLQRMGAIFFEGTKYVTVENCTFERNAIMVSGFNCKTTMNLCGLETLQLLNGGSYTNGTNIPGMGCDGTDCNHPRYSHILYNFAHELGIWKKQSSFYFQAKSCQNVIEGNIFFNGPRAGINFNDGFGGANYLTENILFNTCCKLGDHAWSI